MKIKFNSDHNFHLNAILKLHNMAIVIRSTLHKDTKYYPKVFLNKYFQKL